MDSIRVVVDQLLVSMFKNSFPPFEFSRVRSS